MGLPPVCGHGDLRERLRQAALGGRLPQSLLLHGPEGIGKERLALWLAALVLCDGEGERPCGRCRSCRLADTLQHPDVHWFFPVPSPKGSLTPEKRRDKLEETRLESLEAMRKEPLAAGRRSPSDALFLSVVEEIRARASRRPAMSERSVFVIGDAERMVPQASSPEAANAFLKLLEEPPEDTFFVLTSSRPGFLLPTIRSRVLAVRVQPPAEEEAAAFLVSEAGLTAERASRLARRASGAPGVALLLAEEEDGEDGLGERALSLVDVSMTGSFATRCALAASFPPAGARGEFSTLLDATEAVLRDCITVASGEADAALDGRVPGRLPAAASVPPERWTRALQRLELARDSAATNGNPQAIAAVLILGMARELRPPAGMAADSDRNAPRGRG